MKSHIGVMTRTIAAHCWCFEKLVSVRRLQIPVRRVEKLPMRCPFILSALMSFVLRCQCDCTASLQRSTWSAFRARNHYVYFVQPLNSRGGSALKIGLSEGKTARGELREATSEAKTARGKLRGATCEGDKRGARRHAARCTPAAIDAFWP